MYHNFCVSRTIGLFVNNLDEEYQISVFQGVRDAARALGLNLVCVQGEVVSTLEQDPSEQLPSFGNLPLDAALILSSVVISDEALVGYPAGDQLFAGIPTISIGYGLFHLPSVVVDSRDCMRQLVRHVMEAHGCRKLLYLGGPKSHVDNGVREAVLDSVCSEYRNSQPMLTVLKAYGGFNEYSGYQIVNDYIEAHPLEPLDAIVCANDNMAIGALKAIQQREPSSPWHSCAITGFDDIPHASQHRPSLTTVRQPLSEIGAVAVELAARAMKGREVETIVHIAADLQVRESCGCKAEAEDPKSYSALQAERFAIERHLRTVSFFGQRMTEVHDLDGLVHNLDGFLQSIGVQTYYLLRYVRPGKVPDTKGHLLYSRTAGGTSMDLRGEREVVVQDFWRQLLGPSETGSASWCLYQLRSGSDLLGVVAYEADDYSHPQVGASSIFIANTLNRLRMMEWDRQRTEFLEEMVALRTQDLVSVNKELTLESARRRAVEAEVIKISELERLRFSMDLHDDICQRLGGMSMFAKGIARKEDIPQLVEMIDETLRLTRQYAHDSAPMELRQLGLREALQRLCASIQARAKVTTEFHWDGISEIELQPEIEVNVYRIVQEALQNAVKHAKAATISVRIRAEARKICLEIADDGVGIAEVDTEGSLKVLRGRRPKGLGLRSMQYRAHQLQAVYRFDTSLGRGTRIELEIPV